MVRIGVLSTAHIHMPGFAKTIKNRPDVEVVGVFDFDSALAQRYGTELGAPVVDDFQKILGDERVQAVVICGTTAQHNALVVPAARARKHIFVEKPLAISGPDATRMYMAIKESGVVYQTGHSMRSGGMMRFVKQEIEAGNLGTITRARACTCHNGALGGWFDKDYRWFFDPSEAGGGGFYDLGCHALDILVYFFGAVAEATAAIGGKTIKYPSIDEYGEGLLRFRNGVTATVAAGWVDLRSPSSLEISGTAGHLQVQHGQLHYLSQQSKVPGADGKQPIDKAHFPADLPGAFDLFFDVLEGKADKSTLVPVEDALMVARGMEAMYLGSRLGSWVKP